MNNQLFEQEIRKQQVSAGVWAFVGIYQVIFGLAVGINWFFLFLGVAVIGIYNLRVTYIRIKNIRFFRENPQALFPYCEKNKRSFKRAMIWNLVLVFFGIIGWVFAVYALPAMIGGIFGGIWDYAFVAHVISHPDEHKMV